MKIRVFAGPRTRKNCPVCLTLPYIPDGLFQKGVRPVLTAPGARPLECGVENLPEGPRLTFLLNFLGKNETAEFTLEAAPETAPQMESRVTEKGVDIRAGGFFVTGYYTGTDIPKPYLGPFRDSHGCEITRLDPDARDHPHHRAVWVSHGDVNGVDTWNEPAGRHGFIKNREICGVFSGNSHTAFTAKNLWTDFGGKPLCDEETRYVFYAGAPGEMLFDIEITLRASHGELRLGPTKEAGPLAVRVAESVKVRNTGTMISGNGGINEGEIWMKRAPWVDYSGESGGHVCGIAIFDSPGNEFFPSYWHARDYGLMAVNNSFIGGEKIFAPGESHTWRFRLYAHDGNTEDAGVARRFEDYFAPPRAEAVE